MTNKDFELILIEAFRQTPETRVDFYFSKAKENNCSPITFCTSLIKTYHSLYDYVNSADPTTWSEDETGKKYPILNTINLYSFTNGLYKGNIDNENITLLYPSLVEMGKLLMQKEEEAKPPEILFIPETDNLNEWILSDHISKFKEIEIELFNRGFINTSYKWQKYKNDLLDFLCVLNNYKYFKQIVKGKKIKDFHKRQFISERYGFGKTGLKEAWKKHKPQIGSASIPFLWIKKPE